MEDRMPFKQYESLLALSYAPPSNKSILDWCPFKDGVKLVDIITEYNEKCFQSYAEILSEKFAKELTSGISVLLYDLSTVHKMKSEEFKKIRFLLIDLDAIRSNFEKEKLDYIRKHIDLSGRPCFLLQVSTKPDATPYPKNLRPALSLPFGSRMFAEIPEIICDRETFKKALFNYCMVSVTITKEFIKVIPK